MAHMGEGFDVPKGKGLLPLNLGNLKLNVIYSPAPPGTWTCETQ